MSTIQQDFDRIALVSTDGATCNDHYHKFLLGQLPRRCPKALEVGCGTGTFSRRLAERCEHVTALDLSPEMIRLARARSAQFPNIEFLLADIRDQALAPQSFDCIASIATLHHLPYREVLLQLKAAVKPGGVLAILDLNEPGGVLDLLTNPFALALSLGLRLVHHRRLRRSRAEQDAWREHEEHDSYLTMTEVRQLCAEILPGARVRKHLLWRYSIVWTHS